ncbi:MAG: flavodoxin [Firmicutes bacterium GWF2_51_9]|nr:MAG: flavodoxin [Firmicutes bacterium GWF2_51_9]OGS58569.1 MAG: flavodoxin [Firmicutes bacterium GWE2_51_13]HAM63603.1 flavodoxin [Erysipelotrichaceae bacterium]HBZ41890.1 flavodoxin [Erysipelotrichaceae bacterium]
MKLNDKNVLIAYYSRRGNNYVNGSIQNLAVGNTEIIARKIQAITQGELFHIESVTGYPDGYKETTEVAKKEFRANVRPELVQHLSGSEAYEVIFLGFPNWWGTMPMPVFTFLEEFDTSRKIIIPFCTHEGSGLGNSTRDIKKVCPKASVVNEIDFYGSRVNESNDAVKAWITRIEKSLD